MGTRTPSYYTGTISGTVGSLITALGAILITGEGWTTSAAAGDTIRISINTVSTLEKVAVSIPCTVT